MAHQHGSSAGVMPLQVPWCQGMFLGTGPGSSFSSTAPSTSAPHQPAASQTAPQDSLQFSTGLEPFPRQNFHVSAIIQSLKWFNGHRTICVCGLRAHNSSTFNLLAQMQHYPVALGSQGLCCLVSNRSNGIMSRLNWGLL